MSADEPTTTGRSGWLLIVASILFTAAVAFICLSRTFPLGVPGEWEWHRMPRLPIVSLLYVVVAAAAFIALCSVGRKWIERSRGNTTFAILLAMFAVIPLHWSIFFMPDSPMGPERWILSLSNSSSSGYYTVAWDRRNSAPHGKVLSDTTSDFLRGYEAWIAGQDSFHIGTHPPGLFLGYRWLVDEIGGRPWLRDAIWRNSPTRLTDAALQLNLNSTPILIPSGFSVIVAVSLLTWLAFWLTCPIVYALARQVSSPVASYSAATLWLLTPGPLLFMPLADVGYVLVSTSLAALLVAGPRFHTHPIFPILFGMFAGVVFIVGINLSLAFTVPLFFAAMAGLFLEPRSFLLLRWWSTWSAFALTVAAIALWFRFGLEFNLPAVLLINLQKHRGFYDAFPRSYWPWVGVNLIEFAATIGVISIALAAAAFTPRRNRIALAFLATLIILDLTGKNLSEAGRLWLFLTPLAAAAAAPAFEPQKLTVRCYLFLLLLQVICSVFFYSSVEPLLPIAPLL